MWSTWLRTWGGVLTLLPPFPGNEVGAGIVGFGWQMPSISTPPCVTANWGASSASNAGVTSSVSLLYIRSKRSWISSSGQWPRGSDSLDQMSVKASPLRKVPLTLRTTIASSDRSPATLASAATVLSIQKAGDNVISSSAENSGSSCRWNRWWKARSEGCWRTWISHGSVTLKLAELRASMANAYRPMSSASGKPKISYKFKFIYKMKMKFK